MGLEQANYIPELNPANPTGADPKSEGDNHLRLTKGAIKGSFPNFVGNTTTPKAVSKTEDEINDCAEKSIAETVTGAWEFQNLVKLADATIGTRKAGYRNPASVILGANRVLAQSDEQTFITISSSVTLTTASLEEGTEMMFYTGQFALVLEVGAGTSVTYANALGGATGVSGQTFGIEAFSVVGLRHMSTGGIIIFGNGITGPT